jgi:DNA-3-methyladenine glycosylase II
VSPEAKPEKQTRTPRGPFARGFDVDRARRELARRDPALAKWMRRIGPIETGWHRRFDPVDALANAILYQQLSGKAAATIVGRVRDRWCGGGRMTAAHLRAASTQGLRECGVSFNKIAALKDLAEKADAGVVPKTAQLRWLHDDDLIERLTAVRGIGRWTVEMLLIFRLGRPDVLPIHDLGVQKGVQIVRGLKRLPKPRELPELCAHWAPHSTLASLYMWRVADA